MTQDNKKRGFAEEVAAVSQELMQQTEDNKKNAFIHSGSERLGGVDKEEGDAKAVIAIGGNHGQLVNVLAEFINNPQTADLAAEAYKVAMLKKIFRK